MKTTTPVTDGLRDAVRNCGVTRYELSKQVGVPESALSRFVAGGHGLTLATVDRLAASLGLHLVQSVSNVEHQRGATPDAGGSEASSLKRRANDVAQYAHEELFHSRRGYIDEDDGPVVLYDNNPYDAHPRLRDHQLSELEAWCKRRKIKVCARGSFGEDGYTRTLVLDAKGKAVVVEVVQAWRDIITRTLGAVDGT